MPRYGADLVAGYFPYPDELLPQTAALVDASAILADPQAHIALVDVCAADGAALYALAEAWFGPLTPRDAARRRLRCYLAELEGERAAALKANTLHRLGEGADRCALHTDAFRLVWDTRDPRKPCNGASIMWLNPPYGALRGRRRIEHRWLMRFTPLLAPGFGILMFAVPYNAIAASATYLAEEYTDVACYRLPEPYFNDYGHQVVLVARRALHPLTFDAAESPVVQQIRTWASDPATIPVLGEGNMTPLRLLPHGRAGFTRWEVAEFDLIAARAATRPGMQTVGGRDTVVRELGLDLSVDELVLSGRSFPVAQPLRPGYIAQALTTGIFNGVPVGPDTADSGLPTILAKGVFERELMTLEERTNRDGEVTSLIQVEQPKLSLCVLDLDLATYHDLAAGSEPTGSRELARMNIADLLAHYGAGLARIVADQCPPMHHPANPAHQIAVPPTARAPFRAQQPAIQALIKLIAQRVNPRLLGEVGVGKSTIGLITMHAFSPPFYEQTMAELRGIGMQPAAIRSIRHVLIICPPHLLTTWEEEVEAVLPGARCVIAGRPSDLRDDGPRLDLEEDMPGYGMTIFVMSRESAKLGAAWDAGVDVSAPVCPRCGTPIRTPRADLAKQRARCGHRSHRPADAAARLARDLARVLLTVYPQEPRVRALTPERHLQTLAQRAATALATQSATTERMQALDAAWAAAQARSATRSGAFEQTPVGRVVGGLYDLLRRALDGTTDLGFERIAHALESLGLLLLAIDSPARDVWLVRSVRDLYARTASWLEGPTIRAQLRSMLLTVGNRALRHATAVALRGVNLRGDAEGWAAFDRAVARLAGQDVGAASGDLPISRDESGRIVWGDATQGSAAAALGALKALTHAGHFAVGPACNEPLFQAIPKPRRYPLARYILRYCPDLIDGIIFDEGHEYANEESAQRRAAHRLARGLGVPVILATGSYLNGFSSGMFENEYALSERFRRDFRRDDTPLFVTRYGYRKVLTEAPDAGPPEILRFGAVTDRVERNRAAIVRTLGEAPGVLPLALLQYLLPEAVVIHKEDLDEELPPYLPERVLLTPAAVAAEWDALLVRLGRPAADAEADAQMWRTMQGRMNHLLTKVSQQITRDRFDSKHAGRLFGAIGQLPSFLDRCTADTGNLVREDGSRAWEVRYPATLGGGLVAWAELLTADVVLPKERLLLARLMREWDEGRNVIIFLTHTGKGSGLAQRLQRLIGEYLNEDVLFLDSERVDARRRKDYITRELVNRGRKALIVNAAAVQTGLNNLRYCATSWWHENPNASAIISRQADGRLHRIGQAREVRSIWPDYVDTAQSFALDHLQRKIAASRAVDGLDLRSGLDAAGAGLVSAIDTMSLGQAIYARMMAEGWGAGE